MSYEDFLASKALQTVAGGMDKAPKLSDHLFPFQRDVVAWALERGRAAIFADTGLGKTAMELEWAQRIACVEARPVLILTPLAVAHQHVREATRFGMELTYVRDATEVPKRGVVVTNYERLDRFDAQVFAGVVLDESSILKAFMGSTKRRLQEAFAGHRWKLSCSATPAPNDHLELGNQAEFLEVMSSHEMIARWFINDTSTFGTYRLKGHAVESFWAWVSSWARCFGLPSQLGSGYSDAGYVLPPLEVRQETVDTDVTADRGETLFRIPDMSATGIHQEKRRTADARAARVAELVAAEPTEPWIVWTETDYEADAVMAAVPDAVEVRGSDSPEAKEAKLAAFADGATRVLVTKAKIAGYGLNWQHCARVCFVGATYSYEAFYQAIRRCYRFGQKRPVNVHVVMAQTEHGVWDVMTRKQDDHAAMKVNMFAAMKRAAEQHQRRVDYDPRHTGRLPAWLVSSSEAA